MRCQISAESPNIILDIKGNSDYHRGVYWEAPHVHPREASGIVSVFADRRKPPRGPAHGAAGPGDPGTGGSAVGHWGHRRPAPLPGAVCLSIVRIRRPP